jgi:tryptophan-rich sensory protein
MEKKKTAKTYAVSILIALGVGGLSAYLTRNSMDLYSEIVRPPLSPPAFLFPVVWTILFVLMGVSAAMVHLNRKNDPKAAEKGLFTYALSLVVNFSWSIFFFSYRAFWFSFFWLLLLLFLILRTMGYYRKVEPLAAWLQIPYALWVTFAGYLTLAIASLNG